MQQTRYVTRGISSHHERTCIRSDTFRGDKQRASINSEVSLQRGKTRRALKEISQSGLGISQR